MEFEVRSIDAAATHDLRERMLRPGAPVEELHYEGDDAKDTAHFGALVDSVVVTTASMFREPSPVSTHGAGEAWRLRGMATDPSVQRRGAGSAVLAACEAYVREQGAALLWCNARTDAIPFYEAQGWTIVSDEFDIPTVGTHVVMERALDVDSMS